jgi:hypothetical protein
MFHPAQQTFDASNIRCIKHSMHQTSDASNIRCIKHPMHQTSDASNIRCIKHLVQRVLPPPHRTLLLTAVSSLFDPLMAVDATHTSHVELAVSACCH